MENNSNKSSADEKTNATLFITSTQYLRKRNNNRIDIIKNPKKKTKPLLQVFAKDQGNKEKHSEITGAQIKVMILLVSFLLGSSNTTSIKQKLTLLPVSSIRHLANNNL